MDNCLPPRIYIREWREIKITPEEWYKILVNPVGYSIIEYNTDTSAEHPIKGDDIVRYSFEKKRI